MYLWTAMMTIHWVTSINIVNEWSSDGGNRIIFFSKIEQTVTILTLFTQFFLTSAIIRIAGPKSILMLYGFLFIAAFIIDPGTPDTFIPCCSIVENNPALDEPDILNLLMFCISLTKQSCIKLEPSNSQSVSYTHLTLPTNREV